MNTKTTNLLLSLVLIAMLLALVKGIIDFFFPNPSGVGFHIDWNFGILTAATIAITYIALRRKS